MKTYQDLQAVTTEAGKEQFVLEAIADHKATQLYHTAANAYEYAAMRNVTIRKYQKLLYTITGRAVPDNFSANHKLASNFFNRFVTQEVQYLLGNGATFDNEDNKDKFGQDFDNKLTRLAKDALIGGVAFGFYNYDHIDNFSVTEFVPLWDEEDGALKAGVRFWQIDSDKPLRATLYEMDGYTDYISKDGKVSVLQPKRAYTQIVKSSVADGIEIYDGENYEGFPIVPLFGNYNHQSELVGLQENIDAYDLIKSGFASDLDDASMIYWTIQNAGGMDDIDLVKFVERMKTIKAATVEDDGARAEAHTLDVPYASREVYLRILEDNLYRDAMALNVKDIAAGNVTATQIQAAYEDLSLKADEFEYCILDFMHGLFALAGIDNENVTFKRSQVVNQLEQTQMVLMTANLLDDETMLRHIPWLSPDEIEGILDRRNEEEASRYKQMEKELEDLKAQAAGAENGAGTDEQNAGGNLPAGTDETAGNGETGATE